MAKIAQDVQSPNSGAVTYPPKVKELKHVEAALDKWEEQGKVLKKDSGEQFSVTVRVGIVTAMMPESIQEFIYSSFWGRGRIRY